MNYADSKLLLEYARLQLEIVAARNPTAAATVTAATVNRSTGFKLLRAFFTERLPESKRPAFRRFMRTQIDGVRKVMALAKATGEELSIGEVTFETFDDTGAKVPDGMKLGEGVEQACAGSGRGLPGVEFDDDGKPFVKCPVCAQRWPAHDIGFKLPTHQAP